MEAEKVIAKLEKEGKLRKQKAGISQVEALLRQAVLDLEEARVIVNLAGRAAYVMAYMAMLKAGRALLLERGYVPDDGAQHKTVVEVTGVLLGTEYKAVTSHFEIMRRKRNDMTYEAGALISARDSEKAFSDAVQLLKGVIAQVKSRNHELRFDF